MERCELKYTDTYFQTELFIARLTPSLSITCGDINQKNKPSVVNMLMVALQSPHAEFNLAELSYSVIIKCLLSYVCENIRTQLQSHTQIPLNQV